MKFGMQVGMDPHYWYAKFGSDPLRGCGAMPQISTAAQICTIAWSTDGAGDMMDGRSWFSEHGRREAVDGRRPLPSAAPPSQAAQAPDVRPRQGPAADSVPL